jgi:hypothetical protein
MFNLIVLIFVFIINIIFILQFIRMVLISFKSENQSILKMINLLSTLLLINKNQEGNPQSTISPKPQNPKTPRWCWEVENYEKLDLWMFGLGIIYVFENSITFYFFVYFTEPLTYWMTVFYIEIWVILGVGRVYCMLICVFGWSHVNHHGMAFLNSLGTTISLDVFDSSLSEDTGSWSIFLDVEFRSYSHSLSFSLWVLSSILLKFTFFRFSKLKKASK